MKKVLIILGVIILIGLFVYWLGVKDKGWPKYENARYEFSVNYPGNWSLGEAPTNNDGREFISPDGKTTCRAYGFQNALTGESGNPQTLKEFIDWMATNFEFDKVLERNNTTLAGKEAQELIAIFKGTVMRAVYSLGEDIGYGLVCYYPEEEEMKVQDKNFEAMRSTFKVNKAQASSGSAVCNDLVSGISTPFKDFQNFTDKNYIEVTITSREFWDKTRLPKQVIDFENKGYTCYPMPGEFSGGGEKNGVLIEPTVTRVDWSCELEYNDWKYLSSDNTAAKAAAEKAGFSCVKEDCAGGNVWLCSK